MRHLKLQTEKIVKMRWFYTVSLFYNFDLTRKNRRIKVRKNSWKYVGFVPFCLIAALIWREIWQKLKYAKNSLKYSRLALFSLFTTLIWRKNPARIQKPKNSWKYVGLHCFAWLQLWFNEKKREIFFWKVKLVSSTLFIVKPPFFLLVIVNFNHVKFRMFDVFHYDFDVTAVRPIINQGSRPTSEK